MLPQVQTIFFLSLERHKSSPIPELEAKDQEEISGDWYIVNPSASLGNTRRLIGNPHSGPPLVKNILSVNGVEGVFLGKDFISVNKSDQIKWDEIKHIVTSFINEFYSNGKEFVIDENIKEEQSDLDEIEQKIVKILDQKIRPAVARDGGDIKFKEYKDGVVKVQLQGSCSGCPSSTMTLKQGVQNLLCHYLPEVKEVIAI